MPQTNKNNKRSPRNNRKARPQELSKAENIQSAKLNITMFRQNDPFPPMVRRKLRYADLHNDITTGAAGIVGTHARYRLNSVYDPYYTGAGHQAYGFDQLAVLYNRYRVDRASYKITFTNPSLGANINCICTVAADTSSSLTGIAPAASREWPNASNSILSYEGSRTAVLQGAINLHELCGVPRSKYIADDRYQGTIASDPTQDCILTFAVSGVNGTASNYASTFIEIEYEVTFFERITVAAS